MRTIPASFDFTNKSRNNLVELTTGGTGDFELAVTLGAAKSSGAFPSLERQWILFHSLRHQD